jgi:hypothetical protein
MTRNVSQPFAQALADGHGRCHPVQPRRVFRHGIDTVSFAWRVFDLTTVLNRMSVTRPDPATGELVAPRSKGSSTWLTDPLSGSRVGLTRSPTGVRLLWCEGRLAALCADDATNHDLAPPEMLGEGAERANALARRLGLGLPEDAPVLVRRLDLAADVSFVAGVDGRAFLQALAALDCPRYKRAPVHGAGESGIENVQWRTPKSFRLVHRCYDKGVESASAPAGQLVRLEREWWVPSSERMEPAALAHYDLAEVFAGPLRSWVRSGASVMAVGPYDACRLLRERVGKVKLGGSSGRLLTLRVAERMAGTIGVLGVYGDDWYANRRTASRRRAELRKVGIEFVSDLARGVRIDVGTVLREACEAWETPCIGTSWTSSSTSPPAAAASGEGVATTSS